MVCGWGGAVEGDGCAAEDGGGREERCLEKLRHCYVGKLD